MKNKILTMAAVMLLLGLTACTNDPGQANNESTKPGQTESRPETKKENQTEEKSTDRAEEKTDPAATEEASSGKSGEKAEAGTKEQTENISSKDGVLVVYFSATGNTRGVAEKIAGITGADTYEIKATQEYSAADLNWNDSKSRSTKEQNDPSSRPEIGSEAVSLDGYSTIYIGYPIWWGEEPRIMDTFVESYSFDGITMIPFCTSGSSGIGRSGKNLAEHAGSGTWLDGKRFSGSASEQEIRAWVDQYYSL